MKNSSKTSDLKLEDISHRLDDTLIEFFYLLGIEPNCLNLSELTEDRKFLSKNFKNAQLLTKFPPSERYQSDIDPTILISHIFPNGYSLVESETQPQDEFFYFNFNNLLSLSNADKITYFVCAIIYEPIKPYLDLKYQHTIAELDKKGEKDVDLHKIFVPKALCFSSYVSFPYELKTLMIELLKYIRNNNITLPIEKIFENIVFRVPRPLRAYFCVSCNKTNSLIPNQSKDIDFSLREFNQYNFSSYPFQSILKIFSTKTILGIYRSILLEFPILFFSTNKELLTTTIETFLSLIYPFEYQYPHISILPDCNSGLIGIEKSFIFGINRELIIETKEDLNIIKYFEEMHLNICNRAFLLCDIDKRKINAYCCEKDMYHVVNFEDLGIYPESSLVDPLLNVSKDVYTGKLSDLTQENTQLPDRYTEKLRTKLENFSKENKNLNFEYSPSNNKKIGEDFFYYYLASIFMNYNNYLFNDKDNIEKICGELLTKKDEEINIDNLFMVNQFIQDYRNDSVFFQKFFKTKIFKNFIIRKYLNKPLDKYVFLNFDEKILEKRNKKLFSRKIKTLFSLSKNFQSTHSYMIRPEKKGFTDEELSYMKNNKTKLLNEYYQNIGDDNKLKYMIFPKFIYDDKFFQKKYKHNINYAENKNLITNLKKYQEIEDTLKTDKSKEFFALYNGDFVNRYFIEMNKFEYHNEVYNALYQTWLISFCLTFHYCDEIEKLYRFEELIKILPKVIDPEEKILSILLLTIKIYGNEEMTIKIFELIKKLNYAEYTCLCSKFKSEKKLTWDEKKIYIANMKIEITYFREPINFDKQTNDPNKNKKAIDIKSIRKRTFYTGKEKYFSLSDKEKISYDLYIICNNCDKKNTITNFTVNLPSHKKGSVMVCPLCGKKMKTTCNVIYGKEKILFNIYSIIDLLKIGKDLLKKYGPKIDIDELRNIHKDFFWNCVLYFKFNSLNFEILLKYKDTIPQLKRTFKILKIAKQENQILLKNK